MTETVEPGRPVTVSLHRSLADRAPEVKYVFRTLLRIAGYPWRFVWSGESSAVDIAYGPVDDEGAAVFIESATAGGTGWSAVPPKAIRESGGLPLPEYEGCRAELESSENRWGVRADVVRACYWLLSGAGEQPQRRDRWDNIDLSETFLFRSGLLERPLVSLFGGWLRQVLASAGRRPVNPPWALGEKTTAIALTHDVDYPELIPWIEALRLLAGRRPGAVRAAAGVFRDPDQFWRFDDWVRLAATYGSRPAFYFMTVKGSLVRYAAGTPDAFYDSASPRFRALFARLRDDGCEIGLHASFHAYRSADRIRRERERLEELSSGAVPGNRHHYWHLDPEAPHATLRAHETAGLLYDSSLGFDFYPGFRRGICHPFRPFDPEQRRELDIVQLPPAWMDDHFGRRLERNGVTDPDAIARRLVDAARATRGAVVLDYHVRGMNRSFFPQYGAWLERFLERHVDRTIGFATPAELAAGYTAHATALELRAEKLPEPEGVHE